jgi:hypothetical protein
MKKTVLLLLVLLIILSSVYAENQQRLFQVGDPVYTEIKALYLAAGMAPPSSSAPWTNAEVLSMLDKIRPTQLSRQEGEHLRKLYAYVRPQLERGETYKGSIKAFPVFEMYTHTNTTDYRLDSDWVYDYDSRKPLIDIPIELYMTDFIYSTTNFAILKTRFSKNNLAGNVTDSSEIYSPAFSTNFPFDEAFNHVDINFPERAVISIGFDRINLTIGRDDLFWGSGNTGSLTIGDHLDYYDFVRFMSHHDNFKYTAIIAGFDSPSWTNPNQNSTPDDDDVIATVGTAASDDDNLKFYTAHRLEFRFLDDRINFNLTEAMIYQSSTIDFRYLNPALFYHNFFIRGNANSTLAVEIEVNPWKYLNIYANAIIDEFPYPGEDQTSSGAHPSGFGIMGGLEYIYPLGPGYLTGWAEYVQTDPFLYLRDAVDYIVGRRIFNMESGLYVDENFLGYEYGNDLIVLAGGLEYNWFEILSANLGVFSMTHGENNIDTLWGKGPDTVNQTTPWDDPDTTETLEYTTIISAGVDVKPFKIFNVKPLEGLGVMANCDYIMHENKNNTLGNSTTDFQFSLGISFSY